jgi:hypothetical protein
MELFNSLERDYLNVGEGAEEALQYMNDKGLSVNVVAELKKTLGAVGKDAVSRFLTGKKLTHYFECMYTPQGKIDLKSGVIDESQGKPNKWRVVRKAWRSCAWQQARGNLWWETRLKPTSTPTSFSIKTVQYIGYSDHDPPNRITSLQFYELKHY